MFEDPEQEEEGEKKRGEKGGSNGQREEAIRHSFAIKEKEKNDFAFIFGGHKICVCVSAVNVGENC